MCVFLCMCARVSVCDTLTSDTPQLTRRLKQEGFAFTFASIGQSSKNYCLTINLWQQSGP